MSSNVSHFEGTRPVADQQRFDVGALEAWMREHVEGFAGPLTVEHVAGRIPVIAGSGGNSTAEAIALTRHAKEVGADASLLRTVVREAISRMQAAGLVVTRHGIGTFILDTDHSPTFKLTQEDFATLKDVIAVLELRIGIEVEAAALAGTAG